MFDRHKRIQRDIFRPICDAPTDPKVVDGWHLAWHWSYVTCPDCLDKRTPLLAKEAEIRSEKYVQLLERLEDEVRRLPKKSLVSSELHFLLVHIDRVREELGQRKTAKARTS